MKQLTFADRRTRRGRKRQRPGRKPGRRATVAHVARAALSRWNPLHVTLRAVAGLPSFRQAVPFEALARAFIESRRPDFHVVEYSIQSNHVHLLVEADSNDAPRAA